MMLFELITVFAFNVVTLVTGRNEEYMGYRVYSVKLENASQEELFSTLKHDLIDYWRKPSYRFDAAGRAMVPPTLFGWYEERLAELGVAKDIFVEDVYEYLSTEEDTYMQRNYNETSFSFNDYYRYDQILEYVRSLEGSYENSTAVSLNAIEAATTAEGRPIVYVKLTKHNSTGTKPAIVIEAGINPREWITVPSSLNVVNKLLEANNSRLLDNFEWIIIPVLNPDGYEYTHTNLRLWSKSRSVQSSLGAICPGVNVDRNFDVDWMSSDTSSSPCSHLYGGISAFSEVEARLVQSLYEEYGNRMRLYISLQNKGGFISYPWHYEMAASGMFPQHHMLAASMADAMVQDYYLGVASVVHGDRASGTSTDYLRNAGTLFTFNIDVVSRGEQGVVIPREEIPAIAEDVWRAVSVAAASLL